MKQVVGISLGSDKRNHTVEINLRGMDCRIERVATNGDVNAMVRYIKVHDGKVDAFGLGGMDLYIYALDKRYLIRDSNKVAKAAKITPIVDGSGLKNTLERRAIEYIAENTDILNNSPGVLQMSAMDRIGMAQALEEAGCRMTYGDFLYALKLPIPLYSLKTVAKYARLLVPFVSQLPYRFIYPTGKDQELNQPLFTEYFTENKVIAGDFHYIRRYMPRELPGKVIITNTVTMDDLDFLQKRKVKTLITTTPELEGRSFGTNVIEALLVCLSGQNRELTSAEYTSLLGELDILPRIVNLN